jgi:type I restriction enzyme M protein
MEPRRKRLGQYFTPPTVVDFALRALRWLDGRPDRPPCEALLDPSCGEGAFLHAAIEGGFVAAGKAWGVDRDPQLLPRWADEGLRDVMGSHLVHGDGLLDDPSAWGAPAEGFHWVVGNPPYAGEGLKLADAATLTLVSERFELCQRRYGPAPSPGQVRRFPIEVLFLERFWQLCRPGGLMAIVLPEGIFANDRWRFVRHWLLQATTVHAVVGLPRRAFGAHQITAKTCLALIGKSVPAPGHQVALAEVEHIGRGDEPNELSCVLDLWAAEKTAGENVRPWVQVRRDL